MVQTLDELARARLLGIARGREHHADGGAGVPDEGAVPLRGQGSARGGQEQGVHVLVQERKHGLGLGIAEARVDLEHHRARGREHEPDVEDPAIRDAARAERFQEWVHHPPRDRDRFVPARGAGRRVRAHAARVRALVSVVSALVIPRRRKEHPALPIGEDQERGFLAAQEILENQDLARFPQLPALHPGRDHLERLALALRDHHALARGEAVRLEHDRIRRAREDALRLGGAVGQAVGGGG